MQAFTVDTKEGKIEVFSEAELVLRIPNFVDFSEFPDFVMAVVDETAKTEAVETDSEEPPQVETELVYVRVQAGDVSNLTPKEHVYKIKHLISELNGALTERKLTLVSPEEDVEMMLSQSIHFGIESQPVRVSLTLNRNDEREISVMFDHGVMLVSTDNWTSHHNWKRRDEAVMTGRFQFGGGFQYFDLAYTIGHIRAEVLLPVEKLKELIAAHISKAFPFCVEDDFIDTIEFGRFNPPQGETHEPVKQEPELTGHFH